jgi:glucokinase
VAVDIGGTKTLIAVVSAEGIIEQEVKFPTADNYQQFLKDFAVHLKELGDQTFEGGAAGVAGRLDRDNGLLIKCGNLSWHNEPLEADLERLVGCPFAIENDAKVGGLGEALPLINEFKNVLFITIGTGIGIAYTANGIIDTRIADGGGDVLLLEHEGKVQPWEDFASGSAIVQKYGKKASDISDPTAWKTITHNLSLGILDLIASLSPDVIVIGGGVGSHFDKFGEQLEKELKQYQTELLTIPPIRPAQHPEEAVIYGCYNLIQQRLHGKAAN